MTTVMSARSRKPAAVDARHRRWAEKHREGVSIATIAHIWGVHRSTVAYALNKPGKKGVASWPTAG